MPKPPPSPEKPLLLLIPGLDGTGRFFDGHLEALSRRYRPLAWEFPSPAPADYPTLVEDLGKATVGEPPGSIVVVGESFGGTVALHYVLAFPERVRSLGLVNTFCYYSRRIRIRIGCLAAPLLGWRSLRGFKNLVADRTLAFEGIPPEGRAKYLKVLGQVELNAYRRRLELVRAVDLRSRLTEITVPAVILAAGRDKIVPSVAAARYMAARIRHATVHEFPHAGHGLLLTPGFSLADYV
jgi:pimeloyl-ACP methyl ester carboxylesterase